MLIRPAFAAFRRIWTGSAQMCRVLRADCAVPAEQLCRSVHLCPRYPGHFELESSAFGSTKGKIQEAQAFQGRAGHRRAEGARGRAKVDDIYRRPTDVQGGEPLFVALPRHRKTVTTAVIHAHGRLRCVQGKIPCEPIEPMYLPQAIRHQNRRPNRVAVAFGVQEGIRGSAVGRSRRHAAIAMSSTMDLLETNASAVRGD